MPSLWISSFNKGKLKEFVSLFKELDFEVKSASDLDFFRSPEETGQTFLTNALIKAEALKPFINEDDWVIGEDSGLIVEALDGLPGVHSARYAGPKALDSQNNDKLLKMMGFKKTDNRKAKYFSQIVALGPHGQKIEVSGECQGEILTIPKGTGGFGYDPLFRPEGLEKTMAELTPKEKSAISHRAKACALLLEQMSALK